jgi:hypothetical protein
MPASVAALLALVGLLMMYWAATGLGLFVASDSTQR